MSSLRTGLFRNLTWLLTIKLVALLVLYGLFFGPSHRVHVDEQKVEMKLFDPMIDRKIVAGE
jgi:hypothetical protein